MAETGFGGGYKVTAVEGEKGLSLSTPARGHCLLSLSNPPAPNSLIRSLEEKMLTFI